MMIEERKDVVILKGGQEELDEYKAKHGLTKGEGACCILKEDMPKKMAADIPRDGYYKEKIATLEKKNDMLLKEREAGIRTRLEQAAIIEEQRERIAKLEKALVEAAIK